MKKFLCLLPALTALLISPPGQAAEKIPGATEISLHASIPPGGEKAPAFVRCAATQQVTVSPRAVAVVAEIEARIVQGEAERLVLRLNGAGRVESMTGELVQSWAERRDATGGRFLEIVLKEPLAKEKTLRARIVFAEEKAGEKVAVPLLAGEGNVLLDGVVRVRAAETTRVRILAHDGLLPLQTMSAHEWNFRLEENGRLELAVDAAEDVASLEDFSLRGEKREDGLYFVLEATARVREAGAKLTVLEGAAALLALPESADFRVAVTESRPSYILEFARPGAFPVRLEFAARVRENGDAQAVDFRIPCVQIAPLTLTGFSPETRFSSDYLSALKQTDGGFSGFLPPQGAVRFSWREGAEETDARLFFATEERTELVVGPGLLRQSGLMRFQVLQGKMDALRFALEGAGEILRVQGGDVLGWRVEEENGKRLLLVRLARPKDGNFSLQIEAQTPLGDFPVQVTPLRVAPLDGVRHGGLLRVRNAGAVRLEAVPERGLTQVAPGVFPLPVPEGGQQFVYRVADAAAALRVQAEDVLSEVSVSLVALYAVEDNDLGIDLEMELDIREAPLREFTARIPADYTVSNTQFGDAEYAVIETEKALGWKELKISPKTPLSGRQLLRCRLERPRKLTAAANEWGLEPVRFPGAKSVRGHIGVLGAPGWRVTAAQVDGATEIAPAFFPRQIAGLQQAFRLRDGEWAVVLKVERLGLTVQSDSLHLFAVREGMVSASTTVNYAIVGAPLGEFRFVVPASARNLEFAGKDIRAWKRDGNQVTVSLHKPVGGGYTLLATYDFPLNPHGDTATLEGLVPQSVQSEQGFVLVTSDLPFEVKSKEVSANLVRVESDEIPSEYRMLFDSPLLAAFQYAERPYTLELGLTPRPRGETVNQVVDFAELQTRVAHDGQIVTEARYVVKSHGHPHLRVRAPEGLKLWTARVDEAAVLPVEDGAVTLIPLPPRADANAIATVDLRFAGSALDVRKVRLDAPQVGAPVIRTRWAVTPDEGRLLKMQKGNLAQIGEEENGMAVFAEGLEETLQSVALGLGAGGTVLAALVIFLSMKLQKGRRVLAARIGGLLAVGISLAAIALLVLPLVFALEGAGKVTAETLVFAAPIHLGDAGLFLELAHREAGGLPTGIVFWLLVLAGAVCGALAWRRKSSGIRAVMWTVLAGAGLALHESVFVGAWFGLVGVLFVLGEILPKLRGCFRRISMTGAVALAAVVLLWPGFGGGEMSAQTLVAEEIPAAETARVADSLEQEISLSGETLAARARMEVRGEKGARFTLLQAPAVLTDCTLPPGARLARVEREGKVEVQVVLENDGHAVISFAYELPLAEKTQALRLPTSMAAREVVTLRLAQAEQQFFSEAAVMVEPLAAKGNWVSGARMVLLPQPERVIRWAPQERNRRAEELVFYAESAELYVPSLGVLNGRHAVKIRPAQGLLGEVSLRVPEGLSVADVRGANRFDGWTLEAMQGQVRLARPLVRQWRFDPETRRLVVQMDTAQSGEVLLLVDTQAGMGALPWTVTLAPLTVEGAAGQVGMLGLGTGEDVQIARVDTKQLQAVNVEDFPAELGVAAGWPEAVNVRRSFRYGAASSSLQLHAMAVEPEVRVTGSQTVSLGEDRVVLNCGLEADITRAGIFRLSFALPEGLEIETVSGAALSHWTEVKEKNQRVVVLHLRGRTLGKQNFALTFSGPGIGGQKTWNAPRVTVREASRQTGELFIVPEEGVRLHAGERSGATQFDPGSGTRLPKSALAFRLLQRDWRLGFELETLAPWIQCAYLQEMTLRDGQVRGVVNFAYTIENAATKSLRVRLPENAGSVRFTGPLVADAVPISEENGLWEVKLLRRVLGRTTLHATFQRAATDGAEETLGAVSAADAGLQHGWLALRASGRLELKLGAVPAALTVSDWQSVPAALRQGAPEPVAILRMVENSFALPVGLKTHDPAKLLAVRVEQADLQTMLSAEGMMLTRVNLSLRMAEKGLLRVRLPEGATYWHGLVNNEAVRVAKDGDTLLVPVAANPQEGQPTEMEFFYADDTRGGALAHKLVGPRFDVPLENITWSVHLPEGFVLEKQRSEMQFVDDASGWLARRAGAESLSSVADYQRYNKETLARKDAKADSLIQLSNRLRQEGDQEKARQALSLASNLSQGNAALNEDARVQLNALRMEQIEVGLNRRKKLVSQLGQSAGNDTVNWNAAEVQTNYAPEEVSRQRGENSAEDNVVMRRVAERLLQQQQSAAGTLDSIRTVLPGQGTTAVFKRSLQVGADSDLSLEMTLGRSGRGNVWPWLAALAVMLAVATGLPRLLRNFRG